MQQAGMTVDDLTISIGLPSEEATFVSELQSGSERAFAQLIDRYHQSIYSLIAHSLQDPSDAADVTQEVFLKVFRNIRGFHGEASLRTWLYRIALREASNQRRWWFRHKHQEIALDAPACRCTTCDSAPDEQTLISTLTADGSSPFDQTAQHELRARVEAALHQLPSSYRAVVVLREIEGFSYDEIADLLKINLGTVKSRLMRGRAALRSLLAPSFGIASRSSASADCCAASTEVKPLHKQPGSPSLRSGLEVSQ